MDKQRPQMTKRDKILVLGGCRSGKSAHALKLAESIGRRRLFVATCVPQDDDMRDRVDRHRAERGDGWETMEVPTDLAGAIRKHSPTAEVMLVDCLTLWLSNLMLAERPLEPEAEALEAALARRAAPTVVVSNEVGWGVVPDTPLGRRFRDAQGWLNQRVAALAGRVELVAAGLPLRLK